MVLSFLNHDWLDVVQSNLIKFDLHNFIFILRDLGSRNGTWINGKRLSKPKEESKLIQIGNIFIHRL